MNKYLEKIAKTRVSSRPGKIIDLASNTKDAHDTYQSLKTKYKQSNQPKKIRKMSK